MEYATDGARPTGSTSDSTSDIDTSRRPVAQSAEIDPGKQPGGKASHKLLGALLATANAQRFPNKYIAAALIALGLVLVTLLALPGGKPERFFVIGAQLAPLAILAALAYRGARNSATAFLSYVWLALVGAVLLLNALGNVFLVYLDDPYSGSAATMFKAGLGPALGWTVVLLSGVVILSLAAFARPVRVLVSRVIPINPDSFVHKIALCVIVLLIASSFVPLLVLEGRPPLLELVKNNNLGALDGAAELAIRPVDLVYQFIWVVPATLVAAGWLTIRNLGAVLARLGMVRPSMKQIAAATGLGVLFWAFSAFLLEPGINSLWRGLGWATTDVGAFGQLLSTLMTPLGAVLIGVTAGIGEEMAVRGLLQPRVGLIVSNLLFTSLHAFQYGFDALLSVFVVGLVLGLVRARSNTSTSAIMHAVYNFTTVMAQIGHMGG
jgi:hypothetical protein